MPAIRRREAARGDRGSPYRRMETDLMVLGTLSSPTHACNLTQSRRYLVAFQVWQLV